MKTTAAVISGTAFMVNPLWLEVFPVIWQVSLSIGGGFVLALTGYSKWLEIKKHRRDLGK
jgi:hypothetical protein